MAQDPRFGRQREHRFSFGCTADHLHRFEVLRPGGVLPVIALHCPECTRPSAVDELAEVVAAGRWTVRGLAGLPEAVRADLSATGTLAGVHQVTLGRVREAAEHCRVQFDTEPPAQVDGDGVEQPVAVLDAADDWVTRLRMIPRPRRRPDRRPSAD